MNKTTTYPPKQSYYVGATKVRMETYDAVGSTLVKAYDYLAGMVYQETVTAGTSTKEIDFIGSPEGRALLTHKILGTPAPPSGAGGADRFTYNGKETLSDLDLGWQDYGFRMYNSEIGRWSAVDALSEKYGFYSGYVYTFSNPVNFIDIFGLAPGDPQIGADGLTNEQWIRASNPMANKKLNEDYLSKNKEAEKNKQKLPGGKIDWNAPGADGTNEVFRIYGTDKRTHIFYDTWKGFLNNWLESISNFEGINLNDSEIGDLGKGAAFTLPNTGIFLSFKYYNSQSVTDVRDLLRHEYGHAVQYQRYGTGFFPNVGITSIISAKQSKSPRHHMETWSEKEANTLSFYMLNLPKNWNHNDYPINEVYLNAIRDADWK